MGNQSNADDSSLTEDQREVAEYFATETYRSQQSNELPAPSWPIHDFLPPNQVALRATSFWTGLIGLNVILVIFACLMPMEMKAVEDIINRPSYVLQSMLVQTIVLPPIISFSFASVTPMFWYGPVLVRFALAALMSTVGCLAFVVTFSMIVDHVDEEMWFQVSSVMFAHFLTAGTVALTVQMWSPWTLTHFRTTSEPIPPLGTRSMMELTVVAAIGCAIFLSVDMGDVIEGLLFFGVMGLLSSLAVIIVLIALLRRDRRNRRAAAIAGLFCFGAAVMMSGFMAVVEFGWDSLKYDFLLVGLVSIYGTAIIYGVMWLCVWWLRSCGWRCVSREEMRNEAKSSFA